MIHHLRKNKRLWTPAAKRLEIIQKASNDRVKGLVVTDHQEYSTDFIYRQISFGFRKLLPSTPGPLAKPKVGTMVVSGVNSGSLKKGMIGVCYELYQLGDHKGASFIFNSRFYDGFSEDEQVQMLLEIGFAEELERYDFENVVKLERDYIAGVFDPVLKDHKYIHFYEDAR